LRGTGVNGRIGQERVGWEGINGYEMFSKNKHDRVKDQIIVYLYFPKSYKRTTKQGENRGSREEMRYKIEPKGGKGGVDPFNGGNKNDVEERQCNKDGNLGLQEG